MIIFVDESGDAGFKVTKGSTPMFVIVLVIFDDELEAEETALKIKLLKREMGKSDAFEFKFNKLKRDLRLRFLHTVSNSKFRIRAIVFDKSKLYSSHLRSHKESFYSFALKEVLEHNNQSIINAKIRLDGSGEKAFRDSLVVYLRTKLNSQTKKVMANLKFRDSKKDVLIQLADMVAGTLRRYYERSTGDWEEYRKVIKKREEDVWEFK